MQIYTDQKYISISTSFVRFPLFLAILTLCCTSLVLAVKPQKPSIPDDITVDELSLNLRKPVRINYHKPVFRRQIYEDEWIRMAIDLDKADKVSINSIEDKVSLSCTISKEMKEAYEELNPIYNITEKKLYGSFYLKNTQSIENAQSSTLERNLNLKDDFYKKYLLGEEEWLRQEVRNVLVRKSITEKYKSCSNGIKKFVAKNKRPYWPLIGLSALESENWNPFKYSLLINSVVNGESIKPNEYPFFPTMTNLEKKIATQIAHAFCEFIITKFGKNILPVIIKRFTDNPRSFWAAFREYTSTTGTNIYNSFIKNFEEKAKELNLPKTSEEIIFSEPALFTRPYLSYDQKNLAFTSDFLSSREARADLFISNSDGSDITFAATEVKQSMAWHEPTEGLFFIRTVISAAGKKFNQLCWVPCTDLSKISDLRRGLKFSSLIRGTHFSEVAISNDQSVLSVLKTLPGKCELDIYNITKRHRHSPVLKLIRSLTIGGVLHKWIENDTIVFVEVVRGMWRIVRKNIFTGKRTIIEELNERIYDLDFASETNKLYYSIAWSQYKGIAIREIDLSKPSPTASTINIIPLGGFQFSTTSNGKDIYYNTYKQNHFAIAKIKANQTNRSYDLFSLPDFDQKATPLIIETASSVNLNEDDFSLTKIDKPKLSMHTKVLVDLDTFNLSFIWKDELEQKIIEPTIWYDFDYKRVSWQARYSDNDSHPNWYIGLFDSTTDDFLNLFPLSKFTNEAFFKGATFGINHYLTPRETLSFSLEMKDNIYEPEFFDGEPVPANLRASNHMYRVRYKWDTKSANTTDYVGSLGGRLVELSWADSPGFASSDIRFTETLLDWREFLPIGTGKKHVFAMRLLGGVRNQREGHGYPVKFTLGGPDTLRGVQEDSLEGTKFAMASLEYRFKLFDRNSALNSVKVLSDPKVSNLFFFDSFYSAIFIDAGVASYDRISFGSDDQKGVGIEFRANTYLTRWRPANLRLGYAHGMDSLGENTFYLSTGLSF